MTGKRVWVVILVAVVVIIAVAGVYIGITLTPPTSTTPPPPPGDSGNGNGDEPPPPPGPTNRIFHNGTVLTMDAGRPEAEAVAVTGDHIVAVGTDEEVLALRTSGTVTIDLAGRTLLPGFIDSHAHWLGDRSVAEHGTPDEAMEAALQSGWTSVSELFVNQGRLDELRELEAAGRLRLRVNAYLPLNWQGDRFGNWYQPYEPGQEFSPMLRIGGLKIFVDSGDRGKKFLTEPYRDNPGYYGEVYFTQAELDALVLEAHQSGFQIAAHTGGDAAHDLVLNAYEKALAGEPNALYRHRIEHVMILRDDQLETMRRLGILASFQLSWFHSDWAEEFETTLGEEKVPWVGRWRDLLEAGVPSLGSTDHPWGYGTPGPSLKAIYQATTRVGETGLPPPAWMLAQRISVEQALRLLTIDAAYGTFQEDEKGSIAVGKLADLVVLSENPLGIPPERIPDVEVLLTVVGGVAEHCLAYTFLCEGSPSPNRVVTSGEDSNPSRQLAAPQRGGVARWERSR